MEDPQAQQPADYADDRQHRFRAEWRQLCETLESAQGDELCRVSRDKYQFVKTYRMYGRDFDRLAADLKRSARHGQFQFFCERGLPQDVLTYKFVELLLEDWKAAVLAKKRHVAEVFRFRFNENIDTCIVTGEESAQLGEADSLHPGDALHHLSGRSQPTISFRDMDRLQEQVEQLRARLDQLSVSLSAEIANLKKHCLSGRSE